MSRDLTIGARTGRCTGSCSPRRRIDPETKSYVARRVTEGKSEREAVRCLERYLARSLDLSDCWSPPSGLDAHGSVPGFQTPVSRPACSLLRRMAWRG